ncbi:MULTISPECIES: DUF6286 domain-containing protein [Frigoribacterium]|jgi:hypothetical protein|uniref:DUF6286 domain-containing protein n=1 Tax=Frigoribacterium TaxID=96492 RepID=UPI0006F346DE|nr:MULTISPECIES: DUF6286 domain-containing protein [Frigoribacterium]KQM25975.1 hypothetical protein ASL10_11180 [Frigoribacterium sp. Leaf8]MBD8139709.1 hypothetical protein [Frigoribacterium sp. CFBP 13605]ROS49325.1 hypothetical protein EDF21_3047 [Frigoribacterium sp. PhB118]WAC51516.1 DUF6286 domain-containing protein [Frigoribacterium sp. SL97]VXA98924.1 conserved hypothetical protein [Frigoribacterium sp. 9N]
MSTASLYKRIVRRETHSSRAGIAITLAVLLIVALAWIGTEAVLAAVGTAPLLLAPTDLVGSTLDAASAPVGVLTAVAVVVALIGLVLIVVSLAPGRRGRRGAKAERTVAVVDDRVIARSLARTASYAGDVDPSQVSVSVGKRSALIEVTRTSGRQTDVRSIDEAVRDELGAYDFSPALRHKVKLSEKGTVGS